MMKPIAVMFVLSCLSNGLVGELHASARATTARRAPEIAVSLDLASEKLGDTLALSTFNAWMYEPNPFEGRVGMKGVGVSFHVPHGQHLGFVIGFHYASSGARSAQRGYAHILDRWEESATLREHLFVFQGLLRFTAKPDSSFRPFVEGGYELAYHRRSTHEVAVTYDPWGNPWSSEESKKLSDLHPLRFLGGVGCQIAITPSLAMELRSQAVLGTASSGADTPRSSGMTYALRAQIGLAYRFHR